MLVFLTFASSNMSYKRIKNEAIESKLFDKVIAYDEHDLPEDFQQIMKDRISEYGMKGYAYWSWKPYIIKQTLEEMNDGDILLYMDAGSTLNINDNSIENFNRQLRKVTKLKTIFPTDDALFKMLYLAMMDATKKWTGKTWDWGPTLDQLCIYFADRITPEDLYQHKSSANQG